MYLDRASLRQMAGEVILCGLNGKELTAETRDVHGEIAPLGAILFARNVESAEQVHGLNAELKDWRPQQLLGVDQEGGRVARIRQGVTAWPPMAFYGEANDAALSERVGRALGSEMRALGFDLNFAPVLDVNTNLANPIIGDRAFSCDPSVCAEMGAAFLRGMQASHVAACGKHFPGHGDTHVDSHLALPRSNHGMKRLREVEWLPFRAAVQANVASIMTAHIAYDGLAHSAREAPLPATLSDFLLSTVLREEMGYNGAIISDDIDMKGLSDVVAAEDIGALGLFAGVDVFLACNDPARMLELYAGIVRSAESGRLPHATLAARAERARALRTRWAATSTPWKQASERLLQVRHEQFEGVAHS